MTDGHEYTTEAARAAAARDELGPWVTAFLSSDGSDNAPLGQMLAERGCHWVGPVLLPLDQLNRLAGPAGHPVVEEVDDDFWRDDVNDLAERIDDGLEPAPVIVSHLTGGQLKLEDGNHRVEALRRAGETEVWAVVGFEDPAERDRFIERSEAVAGD